MFENTNSVTLCQNSVFAKFWGCQIWGFRKENCIFCFCLFYVGEIETEKRKTNKMEKAKQPYKNRVVWRWSSKMWKFPQNGFLAKIAWHYLCRAGRKTRIFVHTICFGQKLFLTKTVQTRKNYKNSGFSGNCPKLKLHLFFEKGFFDMGEKVGFTNCVFEKLCKHYFYSVFSKTQLFKSKNCMLIKQKIYEK